MGARDYISGLALLAALATTSGCNGLERRALADTSGAAPIVAAPTSAASGSDEPETQPHAKGFFYDSQGRKVPPTPESIKAYEATLKTPDDKLYRLIDSLDAKKAEEANIDGNYGVGIELKSKLDEIRKYSFADLDDEQKREVALGLNEYGVAVIRSKRSESYQDAADMFDDAIRTESAATVTWANCVVIYVKLGDEDTAKKYAHEFLQREPEGTKSYGNVKRWLDRQ